MQKTYILTIQRYANNGYGIGFLEGKAVFVPYSAVGDVVAVTITRDTKNYCFASISDIMTPSPARIVPECPVFTLCGGCDFLHISYNNELTLKKELFQDTLLRIGGIAPHTLPPIEVLSNARFHYRSHATFQSDGRHIGFYKKDSHIVEPLPRQGCLLLHDEINNAMSHYLNGYGQLKIAVDAHGILCSDTAVSITEIEAGITYRRTINTFFQANRFCRKEMLFLVDKLSQNYSSFLDVGCGVGFFSIYLGKRMNGTGIDTHLQSIEWAKHNAKLNNINDIEFYAMSIENYHPFTKNYDCIIIDPPRQGISKRARKTICAMKPIAIIYVSCNPVTFARDVQSFLHSNYSLTQLYLIDMFPCTHHVECVVLMTREKE